MNSTVDDLPPPPPPPPPPPGRAMSAFAPAPEEHAEAQPDAAFHAPERICPNCGAPVHGPFCYACGQSEKGMVRHLSEVFSDLGDIVFNVDSRIFRSVFDLYLRPGYLTTEYIEGRRARYVSPFRLFFFLCIAAFFAMQSVMDGSSVDLVLKDNIDEAATPAEVARRVDANIAALHKLTNVAAFTDEARADLRKEEAEIRAQGEKRLLKLQKRAAAKAAAPAEAQVDKPERGLSMDGEGNFTFDGEKISSQTHPVQVGWLPDAANAKLNATFDHMLENLKGMKEKPSRAIAGFMSVLPQTLFVLMPLFAVLLKFFYLFKRRLYMEHLLVALHSHAFIFLSLIVVIVIHVLAEWAAALAWIAYPLEWLYGFAWLWVFVYLFWMQKRVYRQGWIMTTIKFSVIGWFYIFLLLFGAIIAAIVSLAVT